MASDTSAVVSTYLVRQQSTAEEFAFRLTKWPGMSSVTSWACPTAANRPVAGVPTLPFAGGGDAPGKADPNCFMLRSGPDGAQFYATTNGLCDPCANRYRTTSGPGCRRKAAARLPGWRLPENEYFGETGFYPGSVA
jgi:hypothetical protein